MQGSIDEIFEYLSWKNSDEIQERGINMASKINHLSVLIMPVEDKSIWENCAKVLANKSDAELRLYYMKLFEWLKDMNWPGAYLIYDRLLCISTDDLLSAYQNSLSVARQTQDHVWEMVLKDFFIEYIFNLVDWDKQPEKQFVLEALGRSAELLDENSYNRIKMIYDVYWKDAKE